MLADYASEHGYRINIKMRLRDAIDVDALPMRQRDRNFLWTAHLDFVVIDMESKLPVLAVEYDGPRHAEAEQAERDRIKDRLCSEGCLPLLRIDSNYARREGRWTVLSYILWAHEMGKSFADAQERGHIPDDEVFYHGSVLEQSEDGGGFTFTGLDMPAIQYLHHFREEAGALWEGSWWHSTDTGIEARDLLALPNGLYLSAHCSIRQFAIIGISALEIAEELSVAELGWLAKQYAAEEPVAIGEREACRLLADLQSWHLRAGWGAGPKATRT
jgi:hypothetical protein